MGLKTLVISYAFPPWGGLGSLRTVYMANRLAECGHEVDVLTIQVSPTAHGALGGAYDVGSLNLIGPKVRVQRTTGGLLRFLRDRFPKQFSVPPARPGSWGILSRAYGVFLNHLFNPLSNLEWLGWGWFEAKALARRNRYDVIYSTDNPVTCRLVAYRLKRTFHIPWVLFLGDPYSFGGAELLRAGWRIRLDRALDERLLSTADKIIVNCWQIAEGYLARFPMLDRNKFTLITDGYDEGLYTSLPAETGKKFRVLYTGTIYDQARDLDNFLDALRRIDIPDLEVVVAGKIGPGFTTRIKGLGLEDKATILGFQPHSRVISLQKGASVLLMVGWSGGYQILGKLFEYFGAKRPILAIEYDSTDPTSELVRNRKRGIVVCNEASAIREALERLYALWKEGRLGSTFDLSDAGEYDLTRLADRFVNLMEEAARGVQSA